MDNPTFYEVNTMQASTPDNKNSRSVVWISNNPFPSGIRVVVGESNTERKNSLQNAHVRAHCKGRERGVTDAYQSRTLPQNTPHPMRRRLTLTTRTASSMLANPTREMATASTKGTEARLHR